MAILVSELTDGLKDRTRWGNWTLRADSLTLEFIGAGGWYEIDLEDITDSASMLDWIYQVRHKPWATAEVMHDLMEALDDIFHPQANLCSGGCPKELATNFLKNRLAGK